MWDFNCRLFNQQMNYATHFCENLFIARTVFEALVTLATFQLSSPSRGDFNCADTTLPNVNQTKNPHVFPEGSLYSACRSKSLRECLFVVFPQEGLYTTYLINNLQQIQMCIILILYWCYHPLRQLTPIEKYLPESHCGRCWLLTFPLEKLHTWLHAVEMHSIGSSNHWICLNASVWSGVSLHPLGSSRSLLNVNQK